jgi:hypothetical protein
MKDTKKTGSEQIPGLSPSSNGDSLADSTPGKSDSGSKPDPYDLDSLRLSQDFAASVGVTKLVTTIPVKKPSPEWFVRTHPDESYQIETAVLELKDGEDRGIYLPVPSLRPALAGEPTFKPRRLVTAINRQGVLFVWPIRLPGADGKIDSWNQSAADAAAQSKTRWVRMALNLSLQAYEISVATASFGEPKWPRMSFQEIIKIAFRNTLIESWDHPILQRLRGEA